jgi:hypothetical protein
MKKRENLLYSMHKKVYHICLNIFKSYVIIGDTVFFADKNNIIALL